MSKMLSKMNLISVVQQLPKEDIETIQGYVEMVEQENNVQKVMIENFVKENQELKNQLETLKETNKQLICKLDKYDAIVDERDELKKQLRTSAIFNEEDIRLDQTKEVFETLANILNTESCSYRYLIYDLLGFKKENYIDLIAGMSITNAIVELEELENQRKEFIDYLGNEIYSIEPKGTGINYNCEYDSEEDYISAMKEQSKLNTLKEILSKYRSIIGGKE